MHAVDHANWMNEATENKGKQMPEWSEFLSEAERTLHAHLMGKYRDEGYTVALTIQPNTGSRLKSETLESRIEQSLADFHLPNLNKPTLRLFGFGESFESTTIKDASPHWHFLARVPRWMRQRIGFPNIQSTLESTLRARINSCRVHMQRLPTDEDASRWASYICKQPNFIDRVLLF